MLTRWLSRGARRMIGELPPDPLSLFNAVRRRPQRPARSAFDVDVSGASKLWLIVADTGSNAPERVLPVLGERGVRRSRRQAVPLSSLTPVDASGLRVPCSGRGRRPCAA